MKTNIGEAIIILGSIYLILNNDLRWWWICGLIFLIIAAISTWEKVYHPDEFLELTRLQIQKIKLEIELMKAVLKKQLDEMTEDELTYLLKRDYLRRLTRYKMTDGYYRDKYKMDFESFESANIIQREKYSFEVESEAQEWELSIDGIKTVERKLRELLPSP